MLGNTGNKRAVCILLECILVFWICLVSIEYRVVPLFYRHSNLEITVLLMVQFFSLFSVADQCELQIGFSMNPSGSNVAFALI